MKIRTHEIEIEATAAELRESQTLSQNIIALLTRAFQSPAPAGEEDETEEEEEENDDT